jgi:hypothetical protein
VKASLTVTSSQGHHIEASLIDASEGGAAINSTADLAIGDKGVVQFEGLAQAVPFIVRYRGDGRINIEFNDKGKPTDDYLIWFRDRIYGTKAA